MKGLKTRELVVFAFLGSLMFLSKLLLEWAPNLHLLGMFTISYTLVYRKKALLPIYVYVLLCGVYGGFAPWWVPHVYVWTVLWAAAMLLPRKLPRRWAAVMYMLLCALHGLLYGVLYAPAQALMFGLDWRGMLAWIAAGLPFDLLHAAGNLAAGALILPVTELLRKLERRGV